MTQEEWEKTVQWVGIVAGSVIHQDGKYLMVQEAKEKVRGLWNLPAGYVDKDEDIEAAAVREAHEETGYEIELDAPIGIYHESSIKPVKHIYSAHVIGGELTPQPGEIMDVQWLTYEEVTSLHNDGKIRADWIYEVISKVEHR